MEENAKELEITIEYNNVTPMFISDIVKACKENKGKLALKLNLVSSIDNLKLTMHAKKFKVDPSFLKEIRKLASVYGLSYNVLKR